MPIPPPGQITLVLDATSITPFDVIKDANKRASESVSGNLQSGVRADPARIGSDETGKVASTPSEESES